jgi:uncharacterized protein YgiM (DUF1202 family)
MKMKVWTILAAIISTSAFADQPAIEPGTSAGAPALQAPPPLQAPAPAIQTPAPEFAPAKTPARKSTRNAASELRSVPLVPGPAIVSATRVNLRGRAGLIGEVIGRLTNGQPVNVIEEVTLKNSRPDEPSAWAKISLPETVNVWVHSAFIDRDTMTVKASKLNLRGGPGENYSVLGRVQKGDAVKELQTKGNWIEIEAPANAYAFVAAQYLTQESPAIVSTPEAQPEIPPTAQPEIVTEPAPIVTATVPENPTIAAPGNDLIAEAPNTNALESEPIDAGMAEAGTPEASTPEMTPEPEATVDENLPPRIVQREGLVRSTISIQAPTKFELVSPDNFRPINYLYTTSTNLDLGRYKGLHIIVTGEEGLDERWKNTPVITIQQIRVLD